ncbi:hypothetical protein ACHAPT_001334 [Fusarium lateritium]
MLLSKFAKEIAILGMMVAKAVSLSPQTRTLFNNIEDAQPGSPEPEHWLHRRQKSDLTSGTITITVAPDEICGFDSNDYDYYCDTLTRCSWESGEINNMFCDLTEITLGCLDRTYALDPDYCDSDCFSNKYYKLCTATSAPVCEEWQLGDDITAWLCRPSSTKVYLDSTRSRKPRDFKTVVLVDGTTITTWPDTEATPDTEAAPDNKATPETEIPKGTSPVLGTSAPTDPPEEEETDRPEPTQTPPRPDGVNVGAVVGGVIGGLAVISLTVLGIIFIRRRTRTRPSTDDPPTGTDAQSTVPDMRSVVSSPTLNQPYSPTTNSPIYPHGDGMPPQAVYQHPDSHIAASPGHLSASTHELAGWAGDGQARSSPGIK